MKQAGTNNPIFVLDEIDKLGNDFRGDPASALLEVLDPEQNNTFRDHYLNVPLDLSNVLFIATCNVLENIPSALRDRMEVIQIPGYTEEEKFFIGKKYTVPKQIGENGLNTTQVEFTDEGVRTVIQGYTREAGLRNLERQIGTLCRKTARLVAEGKTEKTLIDAATVGKLLGPAPFSHEEEQESDEVGIATGLAWTAVGGEILYVETTAIKGKGNITLTGQLGDVMKESAHAALGYIRWKAKDFGLDEDTLANTDIHVHYPQGGIPKDGPSAGITMATAIISRLTGIPIRKDVAMTGEITLTGRVLPIGGLKEKALAAMRHGIKTVIIPEKNKKDLEDIPAEFRERLTFVPVKTLEEVLEIALTHKIKGFDLDAKTETKTKTSTRRRMGGAAAAAAKGRS
jgi:ATP-dependent Lon protease